jgi:hypothetical protein
MKKIIYMDKITRCYVNFHLQYIFVFGDNDARTGFGGQAKEMRGALNAIGIRVKKLPSMQPGSFYTDNEFDENCRKLQEDLDKFDDYARDCRYHAIVFPKNGIGTGMAKLSVTAPKTWNFLVEELRKRGIMLCR